jgi:hypothetical protein
MVHYIEYIYIYIYVYVLIYCSAKYKKLKASKCNAKDEYT